MTVTKVRLIFSESKIPAFHPRIAPTAIATVVNAAEIAVGAILGWKEWILLSEKMSRTLVTVMAIVVLALGIEMMLQGGDYFLQVIISLVIGALVGDLLDIAGFVERIGARLQQTAG